MAKKMTKEEFVEKANKKHGIGQYSYDESNYQGSQIPLMIKCNVCGYVFPQTPNVHLSGCGCPVCGKEKVRMSKLGKTRVDMKKIYLVVLFAIVPLLLVEQNVIKSGTESCNDALI